MKIPWKKTQEFLAKTDYKFLIGIPRPNSEEYVMEWFKLPQDIYESKEYPTCHCGRRYVPLKTNPKECFFCHFIG